MRLKTFTARTMSEAMQMVRAELGDDAIIVSSAKGDNGRGVRITAALEMRDAESLVAEMISTANVDRSRFLEDLRQSLQWHGAPSRLIEKLLNAARTLEANDALRAFAGALDAGFMFRPLPEKASPRPLMLIGPPGVGKTVTIAKLAARAVLARRGIGVVTTDSVRAGAVEQLAAFTRLLKVELHTADTPAEVRRALDACAGCDLVFIDSAGTNPFDEGEVSHLAELLLAANAEPVLVLAAGSDSMEAAETAELFARVGARRLLATRLDLARRFGGLLAAADAGGLMFSEVSFTPRVADGLNPINPMSFARLFLPEAEAVESPTRLTEACS